MDLVPPRAQDRSPLEFDRFVGDSIDGLLRAAFLITWDAAEAEDLVQECLFRVARRWPRVRKLDHPAAYARTVLVNLALDEGKRRSRRRAELQPTAGVRLQEQEDDSAVQVIGRVEASADLLQALGELPPRQRVALVLRYFEDLSEAEVARAMGCSVGTVKSTTSRALERLRSVVELPGAATNTNDTNGARTASNGTSGTAQDVRTNEGSITA
jgi:RNA polymerase sigma-70 factor (sigma-E family)